MIRQITEKPKIPKSIKKQINRFKPLEGGEWDKNTIAITAFKRLLKYQLEKIQDSKCAYCGLQLYETSGAEIEHIAPKGGEKRPKHPELAFTVLNLALSCNFCNGSSKKGKKDIIKIKKPNYKECTFSIVHPHFDDPRLHYDWGSSGKKVVICHLSPEGEYSIELFGLDSTIHSEARAKQLLYEENKDEAVEERLNDILKYKEIKK